ncbi:MAG: glycosyltransferase family 4 protein [Coleofasciculus sp. B1-GNL1-01]|uniref:glycosyltransferase family 4 protein n=1 Tax=Coleofasciculus sp. B1-GNL1-01 TaxID=3068484 RepID=UPI0033021E58
MKVLHICAVGFTVKNLLIPQIEYFIERGLDVEIACSRGDELKTLESQGYIVHPIQIDRKIAPISNLKSITKLTHLISNKQYDLVHVHTPVASVLGRVAAKLARAPRVIYTAHGFYFHDNMAARKYRFYHSIEKVSAWFTDLILTQSQEDLETAKKTGICPAHKLRYLGNGVDLARFNRLKLIPENQAILKKELHIPDQAFPIIGMTGRITAEKGYLELINALDIIRFQYPNVHLLVIGGQLSSERDAFQVKLSKLISGKNLEKHVTFTGFRSDIPELLGLVDVFTLPSYREGLPRSILEAMAMEIPVIATNIRGCREAVAHEKTGLIIPPKDSEKLAEALSTLLSNSALRKAYGRAGRQRAESEFDERLVFDRLQTAYRDLGIWSK